MQIGLDNAWYAPEIMLEQQVVLAFRCNWNLTDMGCTQARVPVRLHSLAAGAAGPIYRAVQQSKAIKAQSQGPSDGHQLQLRHAESGAAEMGESRQARSVHACL